MSAFSVEATDAPGAVLSKAGEHLASDPVRHNLILTLLHQRVAHPQPGRFWTVCAGDGPVGVVLQSPLDFAATITPMPAAAVAAAVDAIAADGIDLPGVSGEAASAAAFAGQWTERTRSAARPTLGMRIYEVDRVIDARPAAGAIRAATRDDRDLLVEWFDAFADEVGEPGTGTGEVVDRRLAAGHLWLWDDGQPVAFAALSDPVAGVARIGPVYTPPEARGRGYASALVGEVSSSVRRNGRRCILYTDLGNPTSNSIYRALGYAAVAEVLRYEFDRAVRPV